MNADALRHFFEYHFSQNRMIWNACIVPLSDEQFVQSAEYSVGSIRNQIVHMMNVDEGWFSDLDSPGMPQWDITDTMNDRGTIRAHWDGVEQSMRQYLIDLTDDRLFDKPLQGEDENLLRWQILLHVVNHGTDHRAQLLRLLHDAGIDTMPQDYVFYVYDNP